MAIFDMNKATVKLCDGRKAALTTTAGAGVNAQLTLTDKSTHRGTRGPVSITIVVAGNNTALSVSVAANGYDITVNSATDGGGSATTTASQAKTAIEANGTANALVTVTLPGDGTGVISAQAKTNLTTGPRTLTLKINEGTMSYSEKKNRKYTRNNGILDTVMNGDDEPVDVKFDCIWDFVKASTGSGTPTPEDVMKQRGEASAWVTSDADPCQPYCIDIEVKFAPNCSPTENEFIVLKSFRYESFDRSFKDGNFSVSGKCNFTEAEVERAA